MKFLDYVISFFALIVVLTFLINHGQIDFRGVDAITGAAKKAIESEEGQQAVEEMNDIASDTAGTIFSEVGERLKGLRDYLFGEKAETEITSDKDDEEGTEENLIAANLIRVVDGDTIIVDIGDEEDTRVRLIGVDTPESVHPDEEKNNDFGTVASNYTKSLLSGVDKVYLQFDEEQTDKYGRTLAYVWTKIVKDTSSTRNVSNYMLNGMLISDGYAIDKMYEPNVAYADVFAILREEAEDSKRGLWAEDDISDIWS